MRKFLFTTAIIGLILTACSNTPQKADKTDNTETNDTIFLQKENNLSSITMDFDEKGNPLSMINFLYLTMDRISFGNVWKGEQGKYFFYRLLLNSWGDAQWLYVEKMPDFHPAQLRHSTVRDTITDDNGTITSTRQIGIGGFPSERTFVQSVANVKLYFAL